MAIDPEVAVQIEALQIQITEAYQRIYRLERRQSLIAKYIDQHCELKWAGELGPELKRLDDLIQSEKLRFARDNGGEQPQRSASG